jgi:uncharacterized protein
MASKNMEAYERLLQSAEFEHDLTSDKSRKAMVDAFTEDYVMVEPPSLPYGGVWEGRDEWLKMNAIMGSLFDQKVVPQHTWDIPEDDLIILYSHMEFTAKATGKTVSFPAIELLYFRDAKICKVEMFLQDTKIILDTLEP